MRRRVWIICLLLVPLGGCSLSAIVGGDITEYQSAGGESANRQLLLNILRAKDDEPLHFIDISQIHGSTQASAQVSGQIPFGSSAGTTPQFVGPLVTFNQSPSFDLGTFDTQDFWLGIGTHPIDASTIGDLLDSGVIDQRVAYLLFFSEIDREIDSTCPAVRPRRVNNFRSDPDAAHTCEMSGRSENWWPYLGLMSELAKKGQLTAHQYTELQPVGPEIQPSSLTWKDYSTLDPSKFRLRHLASGRYQLYSIGSTKKVVFCNRRPNGAPDLIGFANTTHPPPADYKDVCARDEIELAGALPRPNLNFERGVVVRSVYGVLRYLGEVLDYQQANPGDCITLNLQRQQRSGCQQDALFMVNALGEIPAVSVRHGSTNYTISRTRNNCLSAPTQSGGGTIYPCDHSVQVLSIVNLLLNLNKSAQSLPVTPTVRTIP